MGKDKKIGSQNGGGELGMVERLSVRERTI